MRLTTVLMLTAVFCTAASLSLRLFRARLPGKALPRDRPCWRDRRGDNVVEATGDTPGPPLLQVRASTRVAAPGGRSLQTQHTDATRVRRLKRERAKNPEVCSRPGWPSFLRCHPDRNVLTATWCRRRFAGCSSVLPPTDYCKRRPRGSDYRGRWRFHVMGMQPSCRGKCTILTSVHDCVSFVLPLATGTKWHGKARFYYGYIFVTRPGSRHTSLHSAQQDHHHI